MSIVNVRKKQLPMYFNAVHFACTDMKANQNQFGEWLRAWRKELGLTQSEVAEAVGKTKQHISNLERQQAHYASGGFAKPSIELVDGLAKLTLSARRKLQASALIEMRSHPCEAETIEAERQRFSALGLRVFTDGRRDWRIEFAVALPEIDTGISALNLTLFRSENPDCPDGRRREFLVRER